MTQLVKIHYDERGLVPAIVQEHGTGKVLMAPVNKGIA